MCGICGYVDYTQPITKDTIIKKMNKTLEKRGPNDNQVYLDKHVALGHVRLSIIDVSYGKQPMIKETSDNTYVIVYNGELYNTSYLKDDLIKKGYTFETNCDTEVVLTGYIAYGKEILSLLNGIYAFVIYDKKHEELFMARDRLGIKPLFYTFDSKHPNNCIFASEIKSILSYPGVERILSREGLMELIGLGPAHTPGKTFFKNILEIKPGHYAYLRKSGLEETKYWDLETKECHDTEEEAIEHIHALVVDATKKQLVSDVGISSMLSGGLDSSILSKIAKDDIPDLTTFSIDYVGNDQNFVSNEYQLTKDSEYVKIMAEYLKTNHQTMEIPNTSLYDLLDNALIARDTPGMADIDSSMYAFCEKIHETGCKVCLSGECSDEIFGGYPWFYKEHLINHEGFPWALSENLRADLLKSSFVSSDDLWDYIDSSRKNTLKNVVHLDEKDTFENRFRDVNYLTIKWFMNTLIERTDRMSMQNSLEVRVPFADHRIFEYVYQLPAKMKLGLLHSDTPVEKYLLRKAFEKELPNDVVYRKKSPFPKTYDPQYLSLVEHKMKSILSNTDGKLASIISFEYVTKLLETHGSALKENLFGQLMTYPQTLAYLIQIDKWLDLYDITIEN